MNGVIDIFLAWSYNKSEVRGNVSSNHPTCDIVFELCYRPLFSNTKLGLHVIMRGIRNIHLRPFRPTNSLPQQQVLCLLFDHSDKVVTHVSEEAQLTFRNGHKSQGDGRRTEFVFVVARFLAPAIFVFYQCIRFAK